MNRKSIVAATAISFVFLVTASAGIAQAGEIKLLYVGALRSSFAELIPTFEKSSGHKINAEAGAAGAMVARIQKGEAVDVGIVTTAQIEALVTQGKIISGTQSKIARIGMGLAARKGAARGDIASLEAFQRMLLGAKSIGHTDPASGASSAIYAAQLLARLDIAAELRPKIKMFTSNVLLYEALSRGEIELAFGQMTELAAASGVEVIGPLPAPVQNFSEFAAGVVASAKEPDAARAFISFITSPTALAVMKAKGIDTP